MSLSRTKICAIGHPCCVHGVFSAPCCRVISYTFGLDREIGDAFGIRRASA